MKRQCFVKPSSHAFFKIGCAPCPSDMISVADISPSHYCLSRSHHPPYRRVFVLAMRTSSCTASVPSCGTTALFIGTHLRSSDCLFFHSRESAPHFHPLVVSISFHRFVFVFQLLTCSHVPWLFLLDRKVSIHVGQDLDCDGTRSRWECTHASRRGAPSSSSITSSASSSFFRASHDAPWRCQEPSVAAGSVPRSCGRGGARAKLAARILAKATADVGRKVVVVARKTWRKEAPRASHLLDVDVDVQRMRRKGKATQVVSWRA